MNTSTPEPTKNEDDQPKQLRNEGDRLKQSKWRPRVAFILSALLAAVLLGLVLGANVLPEWPPRKSKPTLTLKDSRTRTTSEEDSLPKTTFDPVIAVRGQFSAQGQITLYLGDQPAGTTSTGEDNYFEFPEVLLVPGPNRLRLVANALDSQTYSDPQASIERTVEWEPNEFTRPKFLRVPPVTDAPQLLVRGAALPRSEVKFHILGKVRLERVAEKDRRGFDETFEDFEKVGEQIVAKADEKGIFQSAIEFPRPGRYKLLLDIPRKETFRDYEFSQLPGVTYDPYRSCNATLLFGYAQTKIDLEITLSRDDPEAVKLITGQTSLARFTNKVFGLNVGGASIDYEFWDAVPTISSNDKTVTVVASATSNRRGELPILNGTISVNKQSTFYPYRHFPAEGPKDNIRVRVANFSVNSYFPPPTAIGGGYATWSGNRDRSDYTPNIQVRLDYNPLNSPANFFRVLSLSPYALFGYEVTRFLELVSGFLYTIPIIWTLWLLHKHKQDDWVEPISAQPLNAVCRALVALIYVSALPKFEEVIFLVIVVGVSVLVIALAAWLIAKPRREALWFWTWESLLGIGYASALGYMLAAAIYWLGEETSSSLLPTTLVSFTVLFFIIICLKILLASAPSAFHLPGRKFYPLAFLVALVLAYPKNASISSLWSTEFPLSSLTRAGVRHFFSLIQDLMPYVLLAGIISILKLRRVAEARNDSALMDFGWILFVAYVVGSTPNWFIIPIPMLLALKLYPLLVIQPPEKRHGVRLVKNRIYEERGSLLQRALSTDFAQNFRNSLEQLRKKVNSGDMTPTEFEKRRTEVEEYAAQLEREQALPYGLKARNVILNFGPHETNWENGVHAVKRGLIIALPFLIVYLWTFLLEQRRSGQAYLLLWLIIRLVDFLSGWVISAFFFGYFFPYIRGESGLKKGLRVAATVILCLTPVWFLSGSSTVELAASFLRAGQIFLFFTILGIWAFDYRIFRESLREKFSWKRFTQFGDMPSLTAVASVFITSVGVAVSSVLSGQFTTVVSQLVSVLFPQLPAVPIK